MSFVAMGAAAGTALATGTFGAVVGGTGAALGGIAGGALAGAAGGAAVGAGVAGATGGDIGQGALMGGATGGLTGGLGGAIGGAAGGAAAAGGGAAGAAGGQAAGQIAGGAAGGGAAAGGAAAGGAGGAAAGGGAAVVPAGQIAGQTVGQTAGEAAQTFALAPQTNIGATATQFGAQPAQTFALAPQANIGATATPFVGQPAGQAAGQATNIFGGTAAPLSNMQNAALVGGSRFGVGLASGEDLEQAGVAGLTSGAMAGFAGGLSDLSATPTSGVGGVDSVGVGGVDSVGVGGVDPVGVGPLDPSYVPVDEMLPTPDLSATSLPQGLDAQPVAQPGADFDWTSVTKSNPDMMGDVTGTDTSLWDRPGNLYDKFDTYEEAATNAPGVLIPGAVATAGLGAMAAANDYGDNLSDYEEMMADRRKGYGATVRSIQDSYARAGRDAPTGLSGTDWTIPSYAGGGIAGLTRGAGDGTSDSIPAIIDNQQRARLSTDEFVVPADVVSHLGNGSTTAGARNLYAMMDRIRRDRTASKSQPKDINARKYVPA